MSTPKVLIVEDEHALAAALATVVRRMGAAPETVSSASRAITSIRAGVPDAIVLDIGLPDMSGLEVLEKCFGKEVAVPVLVITAHGNLDNAIAARRLGVAEYLTKPLDLHQFESTLAGLLRDTRAELAGKDTGSDAVETDANLTMIGAAPSMQPVFRDIASACTARVPVVISGDTGVGKTLAARVIHANTETIDGPMAIHDAATDSQPLAVRASGAGSLLIENTDELPADQQSELLRLLEEASDGNSARRFLFTAKADLHTAVSEGRFREDLYYRSRALDIRIPRLADRRSDIAALAAFFLGKACSDRPLAFAPEILPLLENHAWPGNVRELRHAIEYAVALCGGAQILPQHLPGSVTMASRGPSATSELEAAVASWIDKESANKEPLTYASLSDQMEKLLLTELLKRYDNKPTRLAESLGMNRTTLRKRCARLGIGTGKTRG